MSPPIHPTESTCVEARVQLQMAWVEGRIGQIACCGGQSGEALSDVDSRLVSHLESCMACRKETQALESIDKLIAKGCLQLKQSTPLPGEDKFAKMLRSVISHPDTATIKRIRHTLRPVLWLTLILFSLLAFCALLAAAYKIFVQ